MQHILTGQQIVPKIYFNGLWYNIPEKIYVDGIWYRFNYYTSNILITEIPGSTATDRINFTIRLMSEILP
jgi:hypothetical protein